MAPTSAKTLMKDFRASFRRKKVVDSTPKIDKAKELEEEELNKLSELKENAAGKIPPQYTDADLLAFLRARSLSVKEAERLMKVDYNLRIFLRLDELLKHPDIPEMTITTKYSCSGILGCDKEGSLVRVINPGLSDFKGFTRCISTIENFRQFLWFLEKDLQRQKMENRKTGRKKLQMLYIINLENLSMSKIMYKPVLDTAILSVKLLQDHYHDIVKTAFVINAPTFFSSIFKFFKPVIKDALHKRIKVYEGDSWKDELLKHIDADVLPVSLGGTRVDCNNDPKCSAILGTAGTIPEELYPNYFLNPDDPDVVHVTVPAGSSLNFRYPIKEVGTIARWHFQAKENDIGIGVFLDLNDKSEESSLQEKDKKKKKEKEEDLSNLEQVTPIIRSQCHVCPEVGYTVTWFTGTIIMHLDNTYSWMNAKDLLMKISIEPPSEANKNKANDAQCSQTKKPTKI